MDYGAHALPWRLFGDISQENSDQLSRCAISVGVEPFLIPHNTSPSSSPICNVNTTSRYTIIGANGKVVSAAVGAIRRAGMAVCGVIQDAGKAAALEALGCETAVADLLDVNSIVKAIDGADAVQIIIPPFPQAKDPHQEMLRAINCVVEALGQTRPKRILAISDHGAHISHDIGLPGIFHLSRLNGQKIILRSAEHMQNWARMLPISATTGTLPSFFESASKSFPTVAASDVG